MVAQSRQEQEPRRQEKRWPEGQRQGPETLADSGRAGKVAAAHLGLSSGDKAFAKERATQIAQEWSDGMNATNDGEIRDFVAVGDVDIKVIGAENQVLDTNIPVKQLLEQIVAKLSIPPFLLGT